MFIYKTVYGWLYIKRPRLTKVRFSNGWDLNRTTIDHQNSVRVRNSIPHCILSTFFIKQDASLIVPLKKSNFICRNYLTKLP